jgi:quercetin dioxygenase-like cupin family protein
MKIMAALFLMLASVSFPALAGEVILDNDYVRIVRDATPCALSQPPECSDRVIVALGDVEVNSDGTRQLLGRGDISVFAAGQSYEVRNGASYFEVSIKATHPPALSPGETIPPQKNAIRHDGKDFFVFEEKLEPGDTRARHSHSQRVVIQLNRARLEQWPDGEPAKFVETVPERLAFSPPVIHAVKNVGDIPLRGIIIEFKPK